MNFYNLIRVIAFLCVIVVQFQHNTIENNNNSDL